MKIKIDLALFAILLICISSFVDAKELKLNEKILAYEINNEFYFSHANSLILKENKLFVLENLKHRIIVFEINNEKLNYLQSIGTEGKGPGDLYLPVCFSIDHNTIAVNDQVGVSLFTLNGKFKSKFRTFSGIVSAFISNNFYHTLSINTELNKLITVFDKNGKRIAHMLPKYLKINYSNNRKLDSITLERYFYNGNIFTDSNNIYYLNTVFGTITKLDKSGNVLASVSLDPMLSKKAIEGIKKNEKMLYDGLEIESFSGGGMGIRELTICRESYFYKNKLYILDQIYHGNVKNRNGAVKLRELFIRSFDLITMKPDDRYLFEIDSKEDYIQSFAVNSLGNEIYFILCREIGDGLAMVKYSIQE